MVRRAAAILGLSAVLWGLVLVTSPAAVAEDSGPVIAGNFVGRLAMSQTDHNMESFSQKSGARTYSFGQGCPVSQGCGLVSSASGAQNLTPQPGGGFGWSGSQTLGCVDMVTGELKTNNGFTYTYRINLRPAGTATRGGVTYITALSGTYDSTLTVTSQGRVFDCLLNPDRVPRATEHGTYSLKLAPLAAPTAIPQSPPIALPEATTRETTATLPGFRLPQTDDQRESAAAVDGGTRSSLPGALVTPSQALKSIGSRLPQDLLLVALLGLLIVFPAQLFNSTYEENHGRIDRQLARLRFWRRRPAEETASEVVRSRGRRLAVFFGCAAIGTLLAGFLDPGFGADTASFALVTGVFLAVLVTVLVVVLAGRVYRSVSHHETGWYLEAIPSALLVAAVCLLVSRMTHFQPGYLYGVLGGAVFLAALDRRGEGRAEVTVAVVAFVLAMGAWIAFEPVAGAASHADASYPTLALDSLLAALFIGGLEGILFGLIPLRFLPGARIKNWSWVAWGLLMAVVGYVFVHVLLRPESGYLGRSTAASVTTTIALFAAFAVISVLFWGYFRWRPSTEEPDEETPEPHTAEVTAATKAPEAEPARIPVDSQGDVVADGTPRVPRQQGSPAGDES